MTYPLVTAIIPTYNRSALLRQALASVAAQTYRPIQVIVVDDGSSEPIKPVVRESFEGVAGIEWLYLRQENAGPGAARNRGIEIAKGEYIAFLDSDDLWSPIMLSATATYLHANPKVDLVVGGWDVVSDVGAQIMGACQPSGLQAEVDQNFLKALLMRNLFPIHSALVRKHIFQMSGYFDETLVALEDWDLWIRISACGVKIKFLNDLVAHWRMHDISRRSHSVDSFSVSVSRIFNNLHNAQLRKIGLEDFILHAEMHAWLNRAIYYQSGNASNEVGICINKFEDLYFKSPYNAEMILRYLKIMPKLAQAKTVSLKVEKSMSVGLKRKWEFQKKEEQIKTYKKEKAWLKIIKPLFVTATLYPEWFFYRALYWTIAQLQQRVSGMIYKWDQ